MVKGKYKIRKHSIAWYLLKGKPIVFSLALLTVLGVASTTEIGNANAVRETNTTSITSEINVPKLYNVNGYYKGNDIFVTADGNAWKCTTEINLYDREPVMITFDDNGTDDIYDDAITEIKTLPQTWDVPLSTELQAHIVSLCEDNNIAPEIVIAIIKRESNYNANIVGDNGTSFGLMQIREMYHEKRMAKLGCNNLLDPFQNVTVGVNILREMMNKYDSIEEALTAYNAGCAGAYSLYFSKGIKANDYALDVIEIAENL